MEEANVILGHGQIAESALSLFTDDSYHEWRGVFFNENGTLVSSIFPLSNLVLSSGGGFTRISFNNPILSITRTPSAFVIMTKDFDQIVRVPVLSDLPIAEEVAVTFPAIKARALWK